MVKQETGVPAFQQEIVLVFPSKPYGRQRNVGWGRAQLGRLMSGLHLPRLLGAFMRDLVKKDVDSMLVMLLMAGTLTPSQWTR